MKDPTDTPGAPVSILADITVVGGMLVTAAGVVFGGRLLGSSEEQQDRILRVAVAVLCILSAAMWILLRRTRRDLRRMDEMLTDVRFGAGTKRDRDAVDILVRALRAPDPRARETALRTLRKIAGIDLGEEPAPWEEWWTVARATFTRPGPPPGKK